MLHGVYKEHLSEPWFSLIALGLKKYEGRLYKNRFMTYKVGNIILWYNNDFEKPRIIMTEITSKSCFLNFEEMIKYNGLNNCLPGIPTIEHATDVYYKYFKSEDEKQYGVVSFGFKVLKYKVNIKYETREECLGYYNTLEECHEACTNRYFHLLDYDSKLKIKEINAKLYKKDGTTLLKNKVTGFKCYAIDLTNCNIEYYMSELTAYGLV
jgi:ASC-1-like (ASCH) protein